MNELDDDLRERILSARALPSPPVVTARLVELCEDPDAGIHDMIELLRTDGALAARLMRLANSPIYARRRRTENLRQAVTLLGFDIVLTASLSLTLSANRHASQTRSRTFQIRQWTRSVQSAACAQLLAEHVRSVEPTDAFLAALLQDIGVFVVDRIEPEAYDDCDPLGTHADLIEAELACLGVDHAELGATLLEEWRLPDQIVRAVRCSHRPDADDSPTMAGVIAVSSLIADGFAGDTDAFERAYDQAHELLQVPDSSFGMTIEYLTVVLPDLASLFNAEVPDQQTLTEMAEEAILVRQMKAQAENAELQSEVANLRNVAEELKTQNGLDVLTGLANRRQLDDVADQEFVTAAKNGFPLSVIFADLDDFKLVNDRYGHKVGDELLTQAARRISTAVRDGDVVGRFGGEEFVVVLPGTDREGSDVVAERVVRDFRSRPFRFADDLELAQTVSVGVATFDDSTRFSSVSELIHAADLALYVAKRQGKDQVRRSESISVSVTDEAPPVADERSVRPHRERRNVDPTSDLLGTETPNRV